MLHRSASYPILNAYMHTAKHLLQSHHYYYHSESYTITTVSTCTQPVQTPVTTTGKVTHHNSESYTITMVSHMHTASPNMCYYHSENYTITTIFTCIQPVLTLITTAVKVKHQKCALRFYHTFTQRIKRSTSTLVMNSIACYITSNT